MRYASIRINIENCFDCPYVRDVYVCSCDDSRIEGSKCYLHGFKTPSRGLPDWCPFLINAETYTNLHTEELEQAIDKYFNKDLKTMKMLRSDDVITVIKECIDRPKGIVPDGVYELLPGIKF